MSAARAIEWRHALAARVCDDIRPWEHGTVVRASAFPTYYHYNVVRVEGGDPGLEAGQLAAFADEALAGLQHRRVDVEDLAAGERLLPGFEALGWTCERLAFLHRELPGPDLPPPHGVSLEVGPYEASRPLRLEWQGESIWGDPPDFFHAEEAAAALVGSRSVVASAGGELAGFSAFAAHGDTIEVELVFCLPERRNAGLGGALVARALAVGFTDGATHALIEADDVGDAKRLYERLGFRTIWVRHSFTRRPGAS